MIFHLSIAAHDPKDVAETIASLWGDARAFRFPPVTPGSWVALANDDRRSSLEVYPIDTVLRPAEGDADAYGERTGEVRLTATHAAIATDLDQAAVLALAQRKGWPAKYRRRGGVFGVIEMWIEGRQMVEVLTPDMQAEYRAGMTLDSWEGLTRRTQGGPGTGAS